jgi:Response regulators consisting of a CheY-like receiver domain and a winged-helix DNA-binding domain
MVILVIDDEKNILKTITMYLEGHGFDVITAENGLLGIQKSEEAIPDLIILDLVLPDIDGYMVCKTLKRIPKTCNIPILIMSAKSQPEDLKKAFEVGANEYIVKPFETFKFLKVVKQLLKEE